MLVRGSRAGRSPDGRHWGPVVPTPTAMRRLLIACTLALSFAAHAAPPSAQSVDQLLSVIDMKKTMDNMLTSMSASMKSSFDGTPQVQGMTADQRKRFDAAIASVLTLTREEMDWDKLKPEYAQLYMETFTQEEVDGLLAFYRSPAGRAMIEKMPLLMNKSLQLSQVHMQKLMPRIMSTAQKAAEEAAKTP